MKHLLLSSLALFALLGVAGCASDNLASARVKLETSLTEYVADILAERVDSNEKLSDVQKAGIKETLAKLETEIINKIEQIDTQTQITE